MSKPSQPTPPVPVPDDLPARQGPNVHTYGKFRKHAAIRTTIAPVAAPSTTNQAKVLNPAIIGNPGSDHGLALGDDQLSGASVFHDVFTAYADGLISSPNVVILGELGCGKSSLTKVNYVLRPLMLRDRRAVVIDKKPLGDTGDGEYSELTRQLGAEPYQMLPGDPDSTCLNILDPLILATGVRPNKAAALGLLTAFAELAGDGPLETLAHGTLRTAHRKLLADFEGRRAPVIEDLLTRLATVVNDPAYQGRRVATLDAIDLAALQVQLRMERLLADDLAGMFDGETSKHVVLQSKLTAVNISNLPEDGPATALVIAVVNALLMGMLRRDRGDMKTTLVIEEAWNLMMGQSAKNVRANAKLARALGLSIVAIMHHLSDVPPGSDAMAMIKEAGTAHVFRQSQEDDVEACIRTFGLEASNANALRTLPQGQHLLKVGLAKEIHIRSHRTTSEIALTETDEAMLSRPRSLSRPALEIVHDA